MRCCFLGSVTILWIFHAPTWADSIWDRRDPRYAFLFQDNNARRVGDVITVLISESTVASEQDQRALNKSTSTDAAYSLGNTGRPGQLFQGNSNRTFSGNAQLTSNRVFTDRIAAVVVDILPNGNLVIEGYRSRIVAGEERVLRITGIVRPADIGVGNTISSESIANFRISYLGRGPASRAVNPGYWSRVLHWLWPW